MTKTVRKVMSISLECVHDDWRELLQIYALCRKEEPRSQIEIAKQRNEQNVGKQHDEYNQPQNIEASIGKATVSALYPDVNPIKITIKAIHYNTRRKS